MNIGGIGDDTRWSDFVHNTEYQKCSIEPDGEPLSEEILMNILKIAKAGKNYYFEADMIC